jgi:acetyl esterase
MTIKMGVEIVPVTSAPLKVHVYSGGPAMLDTPLVLHLHSGAFAGSVEMGQTVATLLAEAGAIVMSVDYPVSPQSVFPQTLETLFEALTLIAAKRGKWAGRKSPLFVAGEEAGGNLAAGLALMSRDRRGPVLAGQILLSPMLDACLATSSIRKAAAGPVGCKWADGWHRYLGTADKACHPYAAPLGSSRLGGLPPALIITAEDDPMHDESLAYAKRLRGCSVPAEEHVLASPTQWPCTFADAESVHSDWAGAVRERVADFLARRATSPCPTLSADRVKA